MIKCEFYKINQEKICSLGLYGGFPSKETCELCIENGVNNKEHADRLFAKFKKSHPQDAPMVSGCCDSVRNYIDR
jgi:hypothetical protein